MSDIRLADGIVSNQDIRGGRPRIAGTRITVSDILGALGSGDTIEALLADFPELSPERIQAALRYAAMNFDHVVIAAA